MGGLVRYTTSKGFTVITEVTHPPPNISTEKTNFINIHKPCRITSVP